MKQLRITFIFKDQYSRGEWLRRTCIMDSVENCIEWYGLEEDGVDYKILNIETVGDKKND